MDGDPTLMNIFELLKKTNKTLEDLSTRVWILEQTSTPMNISKAIERMNKTIDDLQTRVSILEKGSQQTGHIDRESDFLMSFQNKTSFNKITQ